MVNSKPQCVLNRILVKEKMWLFVDEKKKKTNKAYNYFELELNEGLKRPSTRLLLEDSAVYIYSTHIINSTDDDTSFML